MGGCNASAGQQGSHPLHSFLLRKYLVCNLCSAMRGRKKEFVLLHSFSLMKIFDNFPTKIPLVLIQWILLPQNLIMFSSVFFSLTSYFFSLNLFTMDKFLVLFLLFDFLRQMFSFFLSSTFLIHTF